MSFSILLLVALVVLAAGGWYFVSGEGREKTGEIPPEPATSFRCKVCGVVSPTFAAAHEHASADHDLAGHHIDEAIEPVGAGQKTA